MLEAIVAWIEIQHPAVVYLLLACAAAVEYLFPPLPGDAIAVFGVFLATHASAHPGIVYGFLTLGSLGGALGAYGVGRRLPATPTRVPQWLGGETTKRLLFTALERFEKNGTIILLLNRFLPSLRAVFFVAAGMRRMAIGKVILWGGLSAALWNALLLAVGYMLHAHWTTMVTWLANYSLAVWALLAVAALTWLWRKRYSVSR